MKQLTIFDVFEEVPEVKSRPVIIPEAGKGNYVLDFPTENKYSPWRGVATIVKVDLDNKKAYCDIRSHQKRSSKPWHYSRVLSFEEFNEYLDVKETLHRHNWEAEQNAKYNRG